MVSRRQFLRLTGTVGALAATAGCLDGSGPTTDDETATPDATTSSTTTGSRLPAPLGDAPVRTPGDDLDEWTPAWSLPFEEWDVHGLGFGDDDLLYLTLNRHDGPAAVAVVDPADRSVVWQTEAPGDTVAGSHAGARPIGRTGRWVTLTDDAVYVVTGRVQRNEWSAVHALDRTSGEPRWSLRRERELAVVGVVDDLLVVTGLEFFPGVGEVAPTHTTPEEPLSTAVVGVDVADGSVRWRREFAGVRDTTVGVLDGAGRVYVGTDDHLVGLDVQGETTFERGTSPAGRLETAGDAVFLLAGPGLDPTSELDTTVARLGPDGEAAWQHDLPVRELLVDRAAERLALGGDGVFGVDFDGSVAWRDDAYGEWLLADPDGDTLYARSGEQADAATAYAATGKGEKRWTFDPPSRNAWPEAATEESLVVSAITPNRADDRFLTVYTVDGEGRATAARGAENVRAVGHGERVYLTDDTATLHALEP